MSPSTRENLDFEWNLPVRNKDGHPSMSIHSEGSHKIVIGVDFGTTATGVSYVSTENASRKTLQDVHCIRDWPGPAKDADYAWKAPSRIAFARENGLKQNQWGFEVHPKSKSYTWMKLLLDPRQATKYDDPSLVNSVGFGIMGTPDGKTAKQLCADYLTEIAKFSFQELQRRYSAEVLKVTPLELWLTVPAVWSDRAKADTVDAAQMAARNAKFDWALGTAIFVIPEPEAAAIAVLSAVTEGASGMQVKPRDGVIVADCGGGTVDITTYEVESIEPRLKFKELVTGTGGKCGSTYIDRNFIKWMEKRFGDSYRKVPWEKRAPGSRFMREFEGHKRDFGKSNDTSRYYEMALVMKDVPDGHHYDAGESLVKLYEHDFRELFDPVMRRVTGLLKAQLDLAAKNQPLTVVKTVLLVGGFGDSAYLNECVGRWCKDNRRLRLLCPEHPQAAIVRGAALSGLHNIRPTHRRSRRHYGVSYSVSYRKGSHSPSRVYTDRWDGTEYKKDYMHWVLAKGDAVGEETFAPIPLEMTIAKGESLRTTNRIYCCDQDDAPQWMGRGVHELGNLESDFSSVDLSHFPTKNVGGEELRHISFELRMYFGQRRGVLCFSNYMSDKEVGAVSVSFSSQAGDRYEGGSDGCAMQ